MPLPAHLCSQWTVVVANSVHDHAALQQGGRQRTSDISVDQHRALHPLRGKLRGMLIVHLPLNRCMLGEVDIANLPCALLAKAPVVLYLELIYLSDCQCQQMCFGQRLHHVMDAQADLEACSSKIQDPACQTNGAYSKFGHLVCTAGACSCCTCPSWASAPVTHWLRGRSALNSACCTQVMTQQTCLMLLMARRCLLQMPPWN